MPEAVSRRLLLAGTAWTVPVIVVGQPAAAATCSPGDIVPRTADLGIGGSVGTAAANGHSVGTMTFSVRNTGTAAFAPGTTWKVAFVSTKAPSPSAKDINVTPRLPSAVFTATPATTQAVNPNNVGTVSFDVTLPNGLAGQSTATFTFDIATQTGVGATELRMDVTFTSWGLDNCSSASADSQQVLSAFWGQTVT